MKLFFSAGFRNVIQVLNCIRFNFIEPNRVSFKLTTATMIYISYLLSPSPYRRLALILSNILDT